MSKGLIINYLVALCACFITSKAFLRIILNDMPPTIDAHGTVIEIMFGMPSLWILVLSGVWTCNWAFALAAAMLRHRFIDKPLPPVIAAAPTDAIIMDDTLSDDSVAHPSNFIPSVETVEARNVDMWWRLSAYCEALSEPKTTRDKVIALLYAHFFDEEARRIVASHDATCGLVRGVVDLRLRVQVWTRIFMLLEFILPLVLLAIIVVAPASAQRLDAAVSTVQMGNTDLYEWHVVAGNDRAVPYCQHYEQANAIYVNEVRLLLSKDMLKSDTSHARCVLRLPPQEGSDKQLWNLTNVTAILQDMTHRASVAHVMRHSPTPRNSSIHMAPNLYILRDGERYLRVTVRKADNSGFEPRMVRERDLLALLAAWQREISDGMLDANLHYCMCPAFLGILDNMTFFFDTTTSQWEIWMQPRVSSFNMLSEFHARRMRFSEKIAAFPYYQNQKILDLLPDPRDHMVMQHDAVHIQYADPSRVQFPDELDSRERYWMGHGSVKRTHETANPFALTVPVTRLNVKLITGADSVCYHHCQHISELLAAAL